MTKIRDYGRILGKITESVWLITPTALSQIIDIVDKRLSGDGMSEAEISEMLLQSGTRTNGDGEPQAHNGVGVLSLYGPIFGKANLMTQMSGATSLETFRSDLQEMLENDRVHSIVLDIDSPGGTSDGVAETGEALMMGSNMKPIYALADSLAGSAAYWLASQCTDIYATPSGSVGSVGAYTVHEDRSVESLQQGRKYTYISAGPFKTEGNPHEPLSQEGYEYRQEVIDEIYGDFVEAVALGRQTTVENVVDNFGGGRMLTSKKALEAGMIDGITTQDALIGSIAKTSPHTPVGVSIRGRDFSAMLESKEMEHSEPGVSQPPPPRTDEDGSDDPAIKGGWRREIPPEIYRPENAEVNSMDELYAMFGVEDDEALVAAVSEMHGNMAALESAVELHAQESSFASDYPAQWAELQRLADVDRDNQATKFSEAAAGIKRMEGDQLVNTKLGLSALALETLQLAHMKFSAGSGTLADFENCIATIVNGGIVEFDEIGSSQQEDNVIDISTAQGITDARTLFAEKVAKIQTENPELSYRECLVEAGNRYPDLAAAYRVAIPA